MEQLDAVTELLDQRHRVLAGDRRPADVELEGHPARVGVLDEDLPGALERAVALDVHVLRGELQAVVVPEDLPGPVLHGGLTQLIQRLGGGQDVLVAADPGRREPAGAG